jgi:peptide subunit release factor 1 (eRF1)
LAYSVAFRAACRTARQTLTDADTSAFDECARRVEHYLTEGFAPPRHGVALFVNGAETVVAQLPEAPLEAVIWRDEAEIAPLQRMLDNNERIAVALFDTQRTRLFTIFLGEIETQHAFEDAVPSKQATGGWFALEQARFERHRLDHLRRHAQRTVRELMDLLRSRSFDRLLLAGPEEVLVVLRRELSRPLEIRLSGTLAIEVTATDAEVLKASLAAAEGIKRQEEQRIVAELLESATAAHVALGTSSSLDALADGSVHLLVLSEDFNDSGAVCTGCDRLALGGQHCPACGAPMTSISNLREAIVRHALAQGARVEIVAGPAAKQLRESGSIGGWTRF